MCPKHHLLDHLYGHLKGQRQDPTGQDLLVVNTPGTETGLDQNYSSELDPEHIAELDQEHIADPELDQEHSSESYLDHNPDLVHDYILEPE